MHHCMQSLNLFNKIQIQLSNSIHTKIHTRSNSTFNIHESLLVLLHTRSTSTYNILESLLVLLQYIRQHS